MTAPMRVADGAPPCMAGDVAAYASQFGCLAERLLEGPIGLLDLLAARSDLLEVMQIERLTAPARKRKAAR